MTAGPPERLARSELAGLWARCWKAMARAGPGRWRTVTIRVPFDDDEERRAVAGLLGRPVRPGVRATQIVLADLDDVVRRPGDGWDLPATVEALHGPLPDRAADEQARRDAIDAACRAARAHAPGAAWVDDWLAELDEGTLARLHGRGQLDLLPTAARILAELPADGTPLPVLAARTTGDTKALASTTLASLVLRGLARRLGEPAPASAAERRALWEAAGVVPDDLASQVLVLGLRGGGGLLGGWLTQAAAAGMPFRATLHQLVEHPPTVAPTPVFVCENPAVLRAAAARLGPRCAPLVCTEGRPSVACTTLLATLADAGCPLHYHGDFDWPGVRIAATVLHRPGTRPWRFGAEDYRAAAATVGDGRERLSGAPAATPWDPELADAMTEVGLVVYEEDVLDGLVGDLGTRQP